MNIKDFARYILLCCLGLTLAACTKTPEGEGHKGDSHVDNSHIVYLVRHGEKVLDVDDPPLSEAGQVRAQELGHILKDKHMAYIYSTDYRRTRETAAPLAEALNLPISSYDPRDLEGFAQTLKNLDSSALVVGHSNTTPQLVSLLGGDPVSDIDEPREYDRMYIVTYGLDGKVSSHLTRFGAPYNPGGD